MAEALSLNTSARMAAAVADSKSNCLLHTENCRRLLWIFRRCWLLIRIRPTFRILLCLLPRRLMQTLCSFLRIRPAWLTATRIRLRQLHLPGLDRVAESVQAEAVA